MKATSVKQKATSLRNDGYSYNYISKNTGVSKSTLQGWLYTIPYTPNNFTIATIGKARAKSGEAKSRVKKESYEIALRKAQTDIGKLTKRDLFMLGIGLYIGEGSKTHDIVRVVNSDPSIIRFAVRWFTDVCGLTINHIVARIHHYPSNDEQDSIDYWHKETGIPKKNFQKSSVDFRVNKKQTRQNLWPYGTLHISVRARGKREFGVAFSRRIAAWMNLVLEYGTKKRG